MTSTDAREKREHLILLGLGVAALVVSGIKPLDRLTWVLEVFPAVAGALIFILLYRRLRFTPLVYRLVLLHALVLMLGGHYSYAKVPLGYRVQDALDLSRNPYDRVGHFMQGSSRPSSRAKSFCGRLPCGRAGGSRSSSSRCDSP